MLPMNLAAMAEMPAADVCYIVVHHTGPVDLEGNPYDADASARSINRYHREELGWSGIGYHFVIRKDGTIEVGRPLTKRGSHVRGLNDCSFGIVLAGHGDLVPWTEPQRPSLINLTARLVREYSLQIRDVIGHHEAYTIPGVPDTGKTCPGVLVSMGHVRKQLVDVLHPPPEPFTIEPPHPPPQ
jgi:N-acetyl-anhydromuramyl-L-alanine amidase AmpD